MAILSEREVALKILMEITENAAYSNLAVSKHLEKSELIEAQRAFVTEISYGTIRWRATLDHMIAKFSTVKTKKISPYILNILRIGVYQLLFMDRVPVSAAVNESVKLAKRYGHHASSGFVNAVLRSIAKHGQIDYPDASVDFLGYLSVRYSYPMWLLERWSQRFDKEFLESLLAAMNQSADFCIRVNTTKISTDRLIEVLLEEGVFAERGKFIEEALIIKNPPQLSRLESFKNGYFQVQDESSMLVGKVLDPKPGDVVMDLCAAPGGKATHIAQLMKNKGLILARDIHDHKLKLINDAAKKLGIDIIKTQNHGADIFDEEMVQGADCVLLDAPCSGLGIIRRKPDIKWTRKLEDIGLLANLQQKMLCTASKYVKPGGVLVYSTCTLEEEENTDHIKTFLEACPDFMTEDISLALPEILHKSTVKDGYISLYPHIDGSDGFYIVKFRKRG